MSLDLDGYRLFERIKLQQKIQQIDNIYEIYEGIRNNIKILVYVIFDASNEIVERIGILNQKSKFIPECIECCYVGNDLYLVYEKPQLITLFEFLQQNEVKQMFYVNLFTQLVQVIQAARDVQLLINLFDPRYIFLNVLNSKVGQIQIKFLSLFGLTDSSEQNKIFQMQGDTTQDWSQDLYNVGIMLQNLITKQDQEVYNKLPKYQNLKYIKKQVKYEQFTGEIQKILQGISDPKRYLRLQLDELLSHSLFNQANQQISIQTLNIKEFKLEDFTFIKNIGQGSFGTCDIYTFNRTKEQVCIKQNIQNRVSEGEIEIMKIVRHPNVIRLYGSFQDNQYLYLVMEYANQGDLQRFIKKLQTGEEKLSQQQMFLWMSQLISAMYTLHKLNIIHRDIKQENILIKDNIVKIADFGISKISTTMQQTHIGSLAFMAPEQWWQKPYGKEIDIFSLGLLFYQLINPTFMNKSLADMQQFYETIQKQKGVEWLTQDIPSPIKEIINIMMKNDPQERATAEQLTQVPIIQKYLRLQNLPGCTNYQQSYHIKINQTFTSAMQNKFIQQMNIQSQNVIKKLDNVKNKLDSYNMFAKIIIYKYLYEVTKENINKPKSQQQFDVNQKLIENQQFGQQNLYLLYLCKRLMNQQYENKNVRISQEIGSQIVEMSYKKDILIHIAPMISIDNLVNFSVQNYKRIIIITNALLLNSQEIIENLSQNIEIYTSNVLNQQQFNINVNRFILVFKKCFEEIKLSGLQNSNTLILGQNAKQNVKYIKDTQDQTCNNNHGIFNNILNINRKNQSKFDNNENIPQNIKIFNLQDSQLPQDISLFLSLVQVCENQIIHESIVDNIYW